jgi:hypothetical protein
MSGATTGDELYQRHNNGEAIAKPLFARLTRQAA